jgi:hypothetical protein
MKWVVLGSQPGGRSDVGVLDLRDLLGAAFGTSTMDMWSSLLLKHSSRR